MIQFERMITTLDAHAAGEPFRIVTGGLPQLPGDSILAKRRYFRDNYDHLRTFLMLEPRGHAGMYGCVLTQPADPEADLGVIFMHNEGYSTMCGHGVIALTKVALETGLVDFGLVEGQGDQRVIRIETPAGLVVSRATLRHGKVAEVAFENVPSFVFQRGLKIELEDRGEVEVDICFGGAFYVYVEAARLGVRVRRERVEELARLGMEIKRQAMEAVRVVHPLEEDLGFIYGTIICEEPNPRPGGLESRNVTIFAEGQIDRSPTGSGTSGRLALLHAQGLIEEGATLINRSIIDTSFWGKIIGFDLVGGQAAVRTEIGGTAQMTGFHRFVLEPDDPLPVGFRLGGG